MILGMLLWFNLAIAVQSGNIQIDQYTYLVLPPIVIEIEIHAENEWLDIYGIYENGMHPGDDFLFSPTQDSFIVGVSIDIDLINIDFKHRCIHPLSPDPSIPLNGLYGGYNRITISLNSKRGIDGSNNS